LGYPDKVEEMDKTIRIYRKERQLRVETSEDLQLLGVYLETDIQEDQALVREVLDGCRDIRGGHREQWQMSGNAHTLEAYRGTICLQSLFDVEAAQLLLTLDQFVFILMTWEAVILYGGQVDIVLSLD
jgi:uncharacterized protein YacL (UPF0231 family)